MSLFTKPAPEAITEEHLLQLYSAWKALRKDEIAYSSKFAEVQQRLQQQLEEAKAAVAQRSQDRVVLHNQVTRNLMNILSSAAEEAEPPFAEVTDISTLLGQIGSFLAAD